jgi:hypothetical protein
MADSVYRVTEVIGVSTVGAARPITDHLVSSGRTPWRDSDA